MSHRPWIRSAWVRWAGASVVLATVSLLGFKGAGSLRIYPGPADPAYSVDLPARYHAGQTSFFRWLGRGGFDLPWSIRTPATLSLRYALGRESTPITVELAEQAVGQGTLHQGRGEARFILPAGQPLRIRFHSDYEEGERLRARFDEVEITAPQGGLVPSVRLAAAAAGLPILVLTLLCIGGMRFGSALGLAVLVAATEAILVRADPYGSARLIERLLPVTAFVGGAVAPVARRLSLPWIYGAFLVGLLLRMGIVLHPFAYHFDHAAHVALVQHLLDRGLWEFWRSKAEMQIALNIGEVTLAGEKMAFPYPTLFYLAAAPLARIFGSVDFAVMTLAAAVSSVEVILVAGVAAVVLPSGREHAPYAAWAAALYPAGYGLLTVALYPSLAAHVAETGALLLLARDQLQRPRVPVLLLVGVIILASALHVSALINLVLFCLVLGCLTRTVRPLLLGLLGLVGSLAVSYRDVFKLLSVIFSSLGDQSFSSYFLQIEPPQSLSFMGGYVWLVLGAVGLALARKTPGSSFLWAWGLSFLLLRVLRFLLGPPGAHLKELQLVAPLIDLGAACVLGRLAESRHRWMAAAVVLLLSVATLCWIVEHERWLWPLSNLGGSDSLTKGL